MAKVKVDSASEMERDVLKEYFEGKSFIFQSNFLDRLRSLNFIVKCGLKSDVSVERYGLSNTIKFTRSGGIVENVELIEKGLDRFTICQYGDNSMERITVIVGVVPFIGYEWVFSINEGVIGISIERVNGTLCWCNRLNGIRFHHYQPLPELPDEHQGYQFYIHVNPEKAQRGRLFPIISHPATLSVSRTSTFKETPRGRGEYCKLRKSMLRNTPYQFSYAEDIRIWFV